jgi:hypothetical protein
MFLQRLKDLQCKHIKQCNQTGPSVFFGFGMSDFGNTPKSDIPNPKNTEGPSTLIPQDDKPSPHASKHLPYKTKHP